MKKEVKQTKQPKTVKQLERYFKGVSNQWRIAILLAVAKKPKSTLTDITEALHGDFKNTSQHTQRLVQAGLLNKKYQGQQVLHTLSPHGEKFLHFIKTF